MYEGAPEGHESPGAGVTSSYETDNLGAGNGIELWSSERAANTLKDRALSPAPRVVLYSLIFVLLSLQVYLLHELCVGFVASLNRRGQECAYVI